MEIQKILNGIKIHIYSLYNVISFHSNLSSKNIPVFPFFSFQWQNETLSIYEIILAKISRVELTRSCKEINLKIKRD